MKKLISVLLTMVLCLSVFAGCGTQDDTRTVATVGDEVITVGELKYAIEVVKAQSVGQLQGDDVEEFWTTEKDGKDAETYIREKGMELLMNIAVMAQAAKDEGIAITSSEVDEYYAQNQESMDHAMETYWVSQDVLKSILRKQMLYNKYRERVLAESPRFNPDEETMKTIFQENFYKAQHILKMTVNSETGEPLSQEEIDQKRAEIDALLVQAKNGADFKALMMEHSEDPGKEQAPDGYVFTEGEMVTEFYEGTKALAENGISEVIPSSYGYHVIKRIPLNVETDFQDNITNVQYLNMQLEEEKVVEELKAKMSVSQEDSVIQKIPVRDTAE